MVQPWLLMVQVIFFSIKQVGCEAWSLKEELRKRMMFMSWTQKITKKEVIQKRNLMQTIKLRNVATGHVARQIRALATNNDGSGHATDIEVRLTAPSWIARGGSATLECIHQVPPQLLYKVEFLRTGAKLLQYVRERVPPFTNYTFYGGRLNMSLATENSITIDNLDPTASGLYWCEVSLETPIFTAASPPRQLTVVYSQKHPPIITFGKPDAVIGGFLRANCTSAPAAPAPKLIWYIDNEKVNDEAVKYYSYRVSSFTRTKGGGGYRHRKHQHRYIAPEFNFTAQYWALVSETTALPVVNKTKHNKCTLKDSQSEEMSKIQEKPKVPALPPISLWVTIAELRAPAHGKLQLSCTATIPDEVGPGEKYADVKTQTVTVAVNELIAKKPQSENSQANFATSPRFLCQLLCYATLLQFLRFK